MWSRANHDAKLLCMCRCSLRAELAEECELRKKMQDQIKALRGSSGPSGGHGGSHSLLDQKTLCHQSLRAAIAVFASC